MQTMTKDATLERYLGLKIPLLVTCMYVCVHFVLLLGSAPAPLPLGPPTCWQILASRHRLQTLTLGPWPAGPGCIGTVARAATSETICCILPTASPTPLIR